MNQVAIIRYNLFSCAVFKNVNADESELELNLHLIYRVYNFCVFLKYDLLNIEYHYKNNVSYLYYVQF